MSESRGNYKMKPILEKGDRFCKLVAVSFSHRKRTCQYWIFKCDCGKEKIIRVDGVKSGQTKSCGCFRNTHTMSKTSIYRSWASMKSRCHNENVPHYKDYGGRGITVCEEWMEFENFYKDMREKPEGKTLDRINNDKGYYKKNCRWATRKEQSNNVRTNRHLVYKNKTQTMAQWAEEFGMSINTLHERLRRGWSVEDALEVLVGKTYNKKGNKII
jgi:hypothetical protein